MKVLFAILKFVLFLIVFAAGSFFPPFHIEHVIAVTPDGTRLFIWDGAMLMAGLFVIILLIEMARKRLSSSGPWTAAAFALAAIAGYAAKFGFLTR
jgi:hypothetical protein